MVNHYCGSDPTDLAILLAKLKITHSRIDLAGWLDKYHTKRDPLYQDEIAMYGDSSYCKICGKPCY